MARLLLLLGVAASLFNASVHAANILAIFPTQFASHRNQFRPLTRALALRGHHVTVLSGFPEPDADLPNYRDIVIEGMPAAADAALDFTCLTSESPMQNPFSPMVSMLRLLAGMDHVLHHSLRSNGTRTLLASRDKFDLILLDITSDEPYQAFIHKFNYPPVIGLSPYGLTPIANMLMGNPEDPAAVPNVFLPFSDAMGLFERVVNTLTYVGTTAYNRLVSWPRMSALLRRRFGEELPSVFDISEQISLLLVTGDLAFDYPRPLVPATKLVGGLHLKPAKPLPEELRRWVEAAHSGVIYFSLGSMVRSDHIAPAKLRALLAAFRALPQRVLWKWESDSMDGLPPNVRVARWLPQNDLLAHPNVRLFVTHGGINSLEEAVYHAVPLVAMPFFGDQPYQARKIVARGIGVRLDYRTLTADSCLDAFNEVLYDDKYGARIKKLSALFRDQPLPPLQRAVFWTEYALRHNGSQHLRSAGSGLPWHRHLPLDLLALALAAAALAAAALATLLRVGVALCQRRDAPGRRERGLAARCVLGVVACVAIAVRVGKGLLLEIVGAVYGGKIVLFKEKRSA